MIALITTFATFHSEYSLEGSTRGKSSFLAIHDVNKCCPPLLKATADLKHHPPHLGGQHPSGTSNHPAIMKYAHCSEKLENGSVALRFVECLPRSWKGQMPSPSLTNMDAPKSYVLTLRDPRTVA